MHVSEERRVVVNGTANGSTSTGSFEVISHVERPRTEEGWRTGKPVEDPDKMKRWGRISARPSEYLIHMRRGKVLPESSGQGASCFKFPADSVAVVPTTVQKLKFTADQVTREKVGIEVTGLAVYRIADPLIAFRMLNFSYPERAQEKLQQLLVEMFVGAARRLVANLTVEDCLTRRKEGIAEELMREIAPVVSGQGRIEDETDRGWGIVIDTIEIQDVRVLSPAVFINMQAPYRHTQEQKAREAALVTERAIKLGEAEASRQIELTKLSAEAEVRARRREADEQGRLADLATAARVAEAQQAQERAVSQAQIETERELSLVKLHTDLEVSEQRRQADEQVKLAAITAEARIGEARRAQERRVMAEQMEAEIDKVRLEAEAQAARHAAQMATAAQEVERYRLQAALAESRRTLAEAELHIVEIEVTKSRVAQELELARTRALKEIENAISPEIIQLTVAQQLPQLAAAFQQQMGEVHVTAVNGANPFGYIAAAVEGVLGLARSAGLSVATKPLAES
jgi:flotillin